MSVFCYPPTPTVSWNPLKVLKQVKGKDWYNSNGWVLINEFKNKFDRKEEGDYRDDEDSYETQDLSVYEFETKDSYTLSVDVPGIEKKDLTLKVDKTKGTLTLTGIRKSQVKYTFTTVREIPDGVDLDKASSKLENGVLTVTLPKVPADLPKTIPIG